MTRFDRWLQRQRINQASRWIPDGARLLDVGCFRGELHRGLARRGVTGIGVDPEAPELDTAGNVTLIRGRFPDAVAPGGQFDCITLLAVFEHVPDHDRASWADALAHLLAPGGHLILTIPSPLVDPILDVLKAVRLIHGMDLEHHTALELDAVPTLFTRAGLVLTARKRFQLGLNNLFVFQKPGAVGNRAAA